MGGPELCQVEPLVSEYRLPLSLKISLLYIVSVPLFLLLYSLPSYILSHTHSLSVCIINMIRKGSATVWIFLLLFSSDTTQLFFSPTAFPLLVIHHNASPDPRRQTSPQFLNELAKRCHKKAFTSFTVSLHPSFSFLSSCLPSIL